MSQLQPSDCARCMQIFMKTALAQAGATRNATNPGKKLLEPSRRTAGVHTKCSNSHTNRHCCFSASKTCFLPSNILKLSFESWFFPKRIAGIVEVCAVSISNWLPARIQSLLGNDFDFAAANSIGDRGRSTYYRAARPKTWWTQFGSSGGKRLWTGVVALCSPHLLGLSGTRLGPVEAAGRLVPLLLIKRPPPQNSSFCRIWFIGVRQFSCKICGAASLLILIAFKPSAEYLPTADLFSLVPHTLQLTLCSHSMCGVLARAFLAPSDAVDGWILFTMS